MIEQYLKGKLSPEDEVLATDIQKRRIEILQRMIKERFGVLVEFGEGSIVYKETITALVEGVGHFEPLRHYAEVHLRLEPGERGSGMQFAAECSEDILDRRNNKKYEKLLKGAGGKCR